MTGSKPMTHSSGDEQPGDPQQDALTDEINPETTLPDSDESIEELVVSTKARSKPAPDEKSERFDENQPREHDGYKFRPSTQAILESGQSFLTGGVALSTNLASHLTGVKFFMKNPGFFGGIFAAGTDAA